MDNDVEPTKIRLEEEGDHIVALTDGVSIVGLVSNDVICIDNEGNESWRVNAAGGVDILAHTPDKTRFLVIDGIRQATLFDSQGVTQTKQSRGETCIAALRDDGGAFAIADDEGTIHLIDASGENIATIGPRTEQSDRITQMTFKPDGILVVSSECIGLTDSETPQTVIQCFSESGQLIHTTEIDSPATSLFGTLTGVLAGLENGDVIEYQVGSDEGIKWAQLGYEIKDVRVHDDDLLIGAWFHLRRFMAPMEEAWAVEHPGLIDRTVSDIGGRLIAISGDNRNDYTRINRIDLYDPDAERIEVDDSDIDGMLDEDPDLFGGALSGTGSMDIADALESTSVASSEEFEEIEDILTHEEMEEYAHSATTDVQLEDLLSDLEDEVGVEKEEVNEGSDENELLENIIDEDVFSAQPPIVDSGEDREVEPTDDGTVTVTLDGRSSQSVDGSIVRWEWRDEEGRPIGDTPAIKVRLKSGHHSFTLTAETDRGTAASDTVTIHVLGEDNDDDVLDLLDNNSEG
ncbi:MAG: hypothetical protein CMB13_04330 [Euryarchaeota archaeon]|nr:hypothetical protein [Euryarchaeota archaeon]